MYTICLEVCKLGKKYFRFEFFFCEYHRIEYRDRYVVCKFEGRGIFLSEISSRVPTGSIFSNLQTSKKGCIYKFVNSKKNTSVWKIFCLRISSHRIRLQVGRVQL